MIATPNTDKYKPHIYKGGGTPAGYKYKLCPDCSKYGVSSRVINHKGKGLIRKICKYCGWMEGN